MKYALALGGGGTRGAFEVGVWQALSELGIEINAITGTSIGAVNGAVFAAGIDAESLWQKIKATDIADIKGDNLFNIPSLLSAIKTLPDGGIDASAFGKFLKEHIDEEKVRNSGIDYGLCTYSSDTKKSCELFLDQIPVGELNDYVFASACFPIFKPAVIDGAKYVDGAIKNNLPVNMLIKRGYDTIISVSVKGVGMIKSIDKCGINIINIDCRTPEVGLMEFDSDAISKSIKSGYYECMRVFGKYLGEIYSIDRDSFYSAQHTFGIDIIRGIEEAADMCGIDKYKVYTFPDLCNEVLLNYKSCRKLRFLVYAMGKDYKGRGVLDSLGKYFRSGNSIVYLSKYQKIQ